MPPQSRGGQGKRSPKTKTYMSQSTPNLPTLRSLGPNGSATPIDANVAEEHPTSPSEPASIEDFSLDIPQKPQSSSPISTDDEDGSEIEDAHVPLPPRPIYQQHSKSYTYLAPSAFAPPFYNRPPTPLPPSPSLTSLLRPTFSSQNSRPTTPDHSSDEGPHPQTRSGTGTQTPNSAAASTLTSSFRTAKPIPRASPKVPTYEYYGFTLYLTSSLAFIVYLLWSFLPSPFLHALGIYYYPNRWWALAIPAWTVMFIVYIYVALAAYNTYYLTLPMKSVECLVDDAANIAIVDANGNIVRNDKSSWRDKMTEDKYGSVGKKGGKRKHGPYSRQGSSSKLQQLDQELDWRNLWNEGTDAVMDIPIGGVCEVLYGGEQEYEPAYLDGGEYTH